MQVKHPNYEETADPNQTADHCQTLTNVISKASKLSFFIKDAKACTALKSHQYSYIHTTSYYWFNPL